MKIRLTQIDGKLPNYSLIIQHRIMEELIKEIERWSQKYEFSFQFWGPDKHACYISKDGVEMASYGGTETVKEIVIWALHTVYEWNRTPISKRACFWSEPV